MILGCLVAYGLHCGWQLALIEEMFSFEVYTCAFSLIQMKQADDLLGSDKVAQQWSSALFLIKLKEFRRLSQVAIDDIIQEWNGLFSHTLQHLHAEV